MSTFHPSWHMYETADASLVSDDEKLGIYLQIVRLLLEVSYEVHKAS